MNLAQVVREITGQNVLYRETLHGGDLSDVLRITLTGDHSTCVAKIGARVATEARMLAALLKAGAPVPDVIGVAGNVLLLEDLGEGAARGQTGEDIWCAFADAMRHLHATTAPRYGWDEEYAFGPVTIPGGWCDDWPTFWAEKRLMADVSALPVDIATRVETLAKRLREHLPARPPASLLHGDLWLGNTHIARGEVWMIDPACYHGHSEVDLAMLHLFGTPNQSFTQRYGMPEPSADSRRRIYQLWPALVHLNLFGSGYRGMVTQILDSLNA